MTIWLTFYFRYSIAYDLTSRFNNRAFRGDERSNNDQDIVESSVGTESTSKEITDRIRNRDDVNLMSDYDYTDTESTTNDSSTEALKLQMYDEIVQRFGPDPQFSEKLRSHGTLERSYSKDQHFPTNISKEKRSNQNGLDSSIKEFDNVEVLLMSQIPETHRSSYRSLIISPPNR